MCPPQRQRKREREKTRSRRHTEGGTGYSCPPQTGKAHTINRNLKTIIQFLLLFWNDKFKGVTMGVIVMKNIVSI